MFGVAALLTFSHYFLQCSCCYALGFPTLRDFSTAKQNDPLLLIRTHATFRKKQPAAHGRRLVERRMWKRHDQHDRFWEKPRKLVNSGS